MMTEPSFSLPASLSLLDHGFGDTVFYASCGVKILQFYENGCFQVLFFLNVYNFHQGSVSYQTNASFINLRHINFLLDIYGR